MPPVRSQNAPIQATYRSTKSSEVAVPSNAALPMMSATRRYSNIRACTIRCANPRMS